MTLVSNTSAGGFRQGFRTREQNAADRRAVLADPAYQAEQAAIRAERQAILDDIEKRREKERRTESKRVHQPAQAAAALLRRLPIADIETFVDATRFGFDWGTFAAEVSQFRAEIDLQRERDRTSAKLD